jgi:Zinc-binding dehydrogenase
MGSAADYVTLPAVHLAARPRSVSQAEAATLPLAALTACQALVDYAALKARGAGAGAGWYGRRWQLRGPARRHPRRNRYRDPAVPGTGTSCSASARPRSWPRGPAGQPAAGRVTPPKYDFVLDASYAVTRHGGRLVTLSASPSAEKAADSGVHAMFFVVTPNAAEMARLAALIDEDKLRPIVSQTFPLADGRKAFEWPDAARRPAVRPATPPICARRAKQPHGWKPSGPTCTPPPTMPPPPDSPRTQFRSRPL